MGCNSNVMLANFHFALANNNNGYNHLLPSIFHAAHPSVPRVGAALCALSTLSTSQARWAKSESRSFHIALEKGRGEGHAATARLAVLGELVARAVGDAVVFAAKHPIARGLAATVA